MFRVGLTGGIASGKSTVAEIWHDLGALVIDADALARHVVQPGTPALAEIVDRFGGDVVDGEGALDRKGLAQQVFSDEVARSDLNAIVHPRVRELGREIERQCPDPWAIVVHMIPLLVETGQQDDFDAVVVVDVPTEVQVERLRLRDGLNPQEAEQRLSSQASRTERLRHADFVIDNGGAQAALRARAETTWEGLRQWQMAAVHSW